LRLQAEFGCEADRPHKNCISGTAGFLGIFVGFRSKTANGYALSLPASADHPASPEVDS
jgi:hypothetical protein